MDNAWTDDLVGMIEDEARVAVSEEGYTVRITKRDGNAKVVTRDFRTDRVNFDIENGVVVRADVG